MQDTERLDYLIQLITMEPPCRPIHSSALLDEISWITKRMNSSEAFKKLESVTEFVKKLSCLQLCLIFTFSGQNKRY